MRSLPESPRLGLQGGLQADSSAAAGRSVIGSVIDATFDPDPEEPALATPGGLRWRKWGLQTFRTRSRAKSNWLRELHRRCDDLAEAAQQRDDAPQRGTR